MVTPKISVVVVVKNGRDFIDGTLNSLTTQTFKDFNVIVVDGQSSDGTLGVLQSFQNSLPLDIVSEPDRSVADGLAKGLLRATGDIVGILCADERYYPGALQQAFEWFERAPDAVMCGGRMDFLNDGGSIVDSYLSAPFDVFAHLACERVGAIVGSFFNRRLLGDALRYDSSIPTCPDYELWGRLGFCYSAEHFRWHEVRVSQAFKTQVSMSFRPESFQQFCRDKLAHLDNLLRAFPQTDAEGLRRRAASGIHMWAAEQLRSLDQSHPDIWNHVASATALDRSYPRIATFVEAGGRLKFDHASGAITVLVPERPGLNAKPVSLDPDMICLDHWHGAEITGIAPVTLRSSNEPWGYSLLLSLPPAPEAGRYWVSLELVVDDGAIGVGFFEAGDIRAETVVEADKVATTVLLPMPRRSHNSGIMLRSGARGASRVRILRSAVLLDADETASRP